MGGEKHWFYRLFLNYGTVFYDLRSPTFLRYTTGSYQGRLISLNQLNTINFPHRAIGGEFHNYCKICVNMIKCKKIELNVLEVKIMYIDEFIVKLAEWIKKYPCFEGTTIGKDMSINSRIVVDEDGYIWIREDHFSWNRVKTNINVSNIVEFRASDNDIVCFYIICENNDGLAFEDEGDMGEIFYYVNGEPSGWGTVVEHFKKFPAEN